MEIGRELESLAATIGPLGHPLRLALLAGLAGAPGSCVCELAAALHTGQPAISHHLGILRRAGLVTRERDGGRVLYRIEAETARDLLDGLGAVFAPASPRKGDL